VKRLVAVLAACLLLSAHAQVTVEKPEIPLSAEQEARLAELLPDLRCLVCQNESLAESRAPLALDLRQVIREQIAAGRTDQEIRDFLVARYGEFALLKRAVWGPTAALWGAPILVLLVGGGWLALRLRQRPETAALSPEEEARLAQLTREERD